MPVAFPVFPTLTLYLMLDKFNAPGWLWGVLGTVMAIIWIACIVEIYTCEDVDVFAK